MSRSNFEGRNQKLVIDYLSALLEDSEEEDVLIDTAAEVQRIIAEEQSVVAIVESEAEVSTEPERAVEPEVLAESEVLTAPEVLAAPEVLVEPAELHHLHGIQ